MSIPRHFARYLSDFPASRVREDASMNSMPICLACHRAMTVLYSLNADGERMLRAECPSCGEVRIITASRASESETVREQGGSFDARLLPCGKRPERRLARVPASVSGAGLGESPSAISPASVAPKDASDGVSSRDLPGAVTGVGSFAGEAA